MAAYGRTVLVSALVRTLGGGRSRRSSSCVTKLLETNRSLSAGSYSQHDLRREIHARAVNLAKSTFSWSASHRALCSAQTPHQEDEYPPLPEYSPSPEGEQKDVFIVRVKGLPWSCGSEDLLKFFSECRIRNGVSGIHLMYHKNGKPTGQAFIELEDEEDVGKALEMHRQYLGPRYVEGRDAESILKGTGESQDGVVRIRGLNIVKDGITLVMDRWGRSSGDAFVQFATQEMADEALKKDREVIGSRYIEVYPSKKTEIQMQYGRGKGDTTVASLRSQNRWRRFGWSTDLTEGLAARQRLTSRRGRTQWKR
ncbi:G-rich sequence factor 1 isoform X1 [Silurus meridionalis]|nr:G-rich sequence factor 1 isoform X1 [Silurus meridionalis]